MGTEFTLVCYGNDGQYLAEVGHEVFAEIDRLEAQLSKYNPRSEISVINRTAAGRRVRVEPKLFELLADSIQYSDSTGGAFDVTAGPLIKAWGFFRGKGRIPPHSEIAQVLGRVGYRHVHLNHAERTIHVDVEGLELDLGAIGKGYAVDQAVDILRRYQVRQALISSGTSSLYAIGAPPGLQAWPISLRNPYDKESAADVVHLGNGALSTSGNYEKFFELGAKTYAHILDPTTGRPVENMLATIVIAPSACAADALSTAFYVMGVERSRDYIAHRHHLTAVFYLPSGMKPRFRRVVVRSPSPNTSGPLLARIAKQRRDSNAAKRSRMGSSKLNSGNSAAPVAQSRAWSFVDGEQLA
jgi:thiamine biosynthesis lipoprotein